MINPCLILYVIFPIEITQVTTQHVTTPVTVQTMQTSNMQQAQPQQQVFYNLHDSI